MESAPVPNDGQDNVPVHVHTLKIHAGEFPFIHLGSDKGLLDGVRPGTERRSGKCTGSRSEQCP